MNPILKRYLKGLVAVVIPYSAHFLLTDIQTAVLMITLAPILLAIEKSFKNNF